MKILLTFALILGFTITAFADGINVTHTKARVRAHVSRRHRNRKTVRPEIRISEELTTLLETPSDYPLELPVAASVEVPSMDIPDFEFPAERVEEFGFRCAGDGSKSNLAASLLGLAPFFFRHHRGAPQMPPVEQIKPTSTPEPLTILLMATGLLSLVFIVKGKTFAR